MCVRARECERMHARTERRVPLLVRRVDLLELRPPVVERGVHQLLPLLAASVLAVPAARPGGLHTKKTLCAGAIISAGIVVVVAVAVTLVICGGVGIDTGKAAGRKAKATSRICFGTNVVSGQAGGARMRVQQSTRTQATTHPPWRGRCRRPCGRS